jgi:3-deoxy-7-phosphoheptulonate synthase
MIITMETKAGEAQLKKVQAKIRKLGLDANLIKGKEHTVLGIIGDTKTINEAQFATMPGVEHVVRILKPYKLASREMKAGPSQVRIAPGVVLGGKRIHIIAGPCAVEGLEMLMAIGKDIKRHGATMLRGGAFKPRTSPYAFQGLGEVGLQFLAQARDKTGLPVVSEVRDLRSVDLVARYADILQVGARNMQNYDLLIELGKINKPVLLKRGLSATLEELLQAAEYILKGGNDRVILCERGIRTYETATRNTMDISAVPVLKQASHLPVVVDPSHAAGDWRLVESLSLAAVAAGADGLLVEVHNEPDLAVSDGGQSLKAKRFAQLVKKCRRVAKAVDRSI